MNIATGAMKAISTTISGASSLNPFNSTQKVTSHDKNRPKYKKGSGIHDKEEVSAAVSIQRWYRKSKDKKKKQECCGKFCSKFCCCCQCHKGKTAPQTLHSQQFVVKHDKGALTLLQKAKEKDKKFEAGNKAKERPTAIRSENFLDKGLDERIDKPNRLSPMRQRDISPILETLRNNEFKERTYDSPIVSPTSNRRSARSSPVRSPASETTHLLKNK